MAVSAPQRPRCRSPARAAACATRTGIPQPGTGRDAVVPPGIAWHVREHQVGAAPGDEGPAVSDTGMHELEVKVLAEPGRDAGGGDRVGEGALTQCSGAAYLTAFSDMTAPGGHLCGARRYLSRQEIKIGPNGRNCGTQARGTHVRTMDCRSPHVQEGPMGRGMLNETRTDRQGGPVGHGCDTGSSF